MVPFRLSISIVSPTVTLSASSPNFLIGSILTFLESLSPNALSGVTSTVSLSPTDVFASASSSPWRTE